MTARYNDPILQSFNHAFKQERPIDNAVAALRNLVHYLGAPVASGAVAQAVYDHPDFSFLSLYHLTQLLGGWGIWAEAGRMVPESLPLILMPALAFVEKPGRACVIDQVPFRIRAREVVKTGDVQRVEAFYRRESMLSDESTLARLLDQGLL